MVFSSRHIPISPAFLRFESIHPDYCSWSVVPSYVGYSHSTPSGKYICDSSSKLPKASGRHETLNMLKRYAFGALRSDSTESMEGKWKVKYIDLLSRSFTPSELKPPSLPNTNRVKHRGLVSLQIFAVVCKLSVSPLCCNKRSRDFNFIPATLYRALSIIPSSL